MLEKIRSLVTGQTLCVLSTVSENRPHSSLMSYIASSDCRRMYLMTSRSTRKYNNILRNPHVSLLIDTRVEAGKEGSPAADALAVTGLCVPLEESDEKAAIRAEMVEKLPHLRKMADHPDSDVLEVKIQSFLLLEGITESHFERVEW